MENNLNQYDVIYSIHYSNNSSINKFLNQRVLNDNYKNKIIIFVPKNLISDLDSIRNIPNVQIVIPIIDESILPKDWKPHLQCYLTNYKNPLFFTDYFIEYVKNNSQPKTKVLTNNFKIVNIIKQNDKYELEAISDPQSGFYSYLNNYFQAITYSIQNNINIETISYKNAWNLYCNDGNELYKKLFKINEKNVYDLYKNYKNDSFPIVHGNAHFRNNNIKLGSDIINTYFNDSEFVVNKINEYIKNNNINQNKTIAVYYRATDKITEIPTPKIEDYIKEVKKLIIVNPDYKILFQSDSISATETFKKEFNNCIIIENLHKTDTNTGIHYLLEKEKLYEDIVNFHSTVLLMANCKYLICNCSNVSTFMIMKRSHTNNVIQCEYDGTIKHFTFYKKICDKAIYGTDIRNIDVTDIINSNLNSYIDVNNHNMLADPHPGSHKTLKLYINNKITEIKEGDTFYCEKLLPSLIKKEKLYLKDTTLICIDCLDINRAIKVIDYSLDECTFDKIKLLSSIDSKYKHLIKIPKINNIREYSIFCIKELYKYVDTKYMLIIQHDGWIIDSTKWNDEFYNYDYVGGICNWSDENKGGNGGFSFRTTELMKKAAEIIPTEHCHPEDAILSASYKNVILNGYNLIGYRKELENYGFNYATNDIQNKFSIDVGRYSKEFGHHRGHNLPEIQLQYPKIYDCFPFFNELELLEIRLNEMYDVVEKFIIIEASKTHSGITRTSIFNQNKHLFEKYLDKIEYRFIDLPYDNNPWGNERYQREQILTTLNELDVNKKSIIIVSDCDEIPNKESILKNIPKILNNKYIAMIQPKYNYKLNLLGTEYWKSGFITQLYKIDKSLSQIRLDGTDVSINCGWHFSWLGSKEKIIEKIKSFAHQEFNNNSVIDNVQNNIDNKTYFVDNNNLTVVKIDDTFPKMITDNLNKYKNFIEPTKINILEFSNQWSLGGTEKAAQIFIENLDKEKFNVFAAGWNGGERIQLIKNHVTDLFISQDPILLTSWIKSKNIDIVHVHRSGGTESNSIKVFKDAGVKYIIEHNIFGKYDNSSDKNVIDKHILISNIQKEIYKSRAGSNYEEYKTEVLYYPINVDSYIKDSNINYDNPIFGRHSRSDPVKWHPINYKILPIIKKEIPNAKFHVIGLLDNYREEIKKLDCMDMVVEFPETSDETEIKKFLNGISVFTHGSEIGESFGMAIAEAMAIGLPIVTHSGGDSAQTELVTDNYNGFVTDPNDIENYANKVIYLLKNPQIKKEMGIKGQQKAKENYDCKKITKQLEQIFVKVLNPIEKINHFYENIEGWFDFQDIYKLAIGKYDNAHFVEIGCWKGKSSAFMATEIANSGKNIKFDCVDTWKGSEEHQQDPDILKYKNIKNIFLNNIKPVEKYINPIQSDSILASNLYKDQSLDFIFIDASHDYENVKNDIIHWLPKLKKDGTIAGHDIAHGPVLNAVKEILPTFKYFGSCWIYNNNNNNNIIKVTYHCENNEVDITDEFKEKFKNEIIFNNNNFEDRCYGKLKYLNIQTSNNNYKIIENSIYPKISKEQIYQKLINFNIKEQIVYEFLKTSVDPDLYSNHIIHCLIDFNSNKCLIFSTSNNGAGLYCYLNYYKIVISSMLRNNFNIEICGKDGFSLYKDINENDVYKHLYKINTLGFNIINKYFAPNDNILNKIELLKIKYNIKCENCIGVIYRGTDKINECPLPNIDNYILKINELLNLNCNMNILLQTDEQKIYDKMKIIFNDKLIAFDEIPKSSNNINVFHLDNLTNKLEKISYFDASIRIISKCKYILTNYSTSITDVVLDYRENENNIYKIT